MELNASSLGGILSALGKLVMAAGIVYPPLIAAGAGLSAVGSVMSGVGADKTANVVKPDVIKGP